MAERFPCSDWPEGWFAEFDDDIDRARSDCLTCPMAQRAKCAKSAVLNGEQFGVWAGVALPGMQYRDRDKLELAVERLRLIAGLARCHRCWEWFSVATPDEAAMDAALAVEEPAADRYQRMCSTCEAAAAEQVASAGRLQFRSPAVACRTVQPSAIIRRNRSTVRPNVLAATGHA
jgi:hypothetical protein